MKIKGLYNMPGSKFYWYRWTGHDGKRRAVSLKTDDVGEAIKAVKRIQAGEAFARWERAEPVATTATKLVEDYLEKAKERAKKPMRPRTAQMVRYVLLKFLKDNGIQTAREITLPTIERWLGNLKEAGRSGDTLNRYGNCLRPFVSYLVAQKLIGGADFQKFDVPERAATGRKNWLQLEVANRVIANSKDPDLSFILFCGFHAGLRKSEIIAAKVGWFDLREGLLHVQNDPASGFILKDRENRSIPLSKDFKEFLANFLRDRDHDSYVLRPLPNPRSQGRSDYRYDFKRRVYSHFKRCGVRCTLHDMRRSFASNLVSHGESIYKVAKWLGDGVAVVERSYGHLAPADRGIDVLNASPVPSAPQPAFAGNAL